MTLRKRFIAILLTLLVCSGVYTVGAIGMEITPKVEEEEPKENLFGHRDTLYLWYADEALTDYLNSVAVAYSEYQSEVRVVPVYTSGLEYLETINQASVQTQEVPDLYIVSNDSLEKAYLAGLASQIKVPKDAAPMNETYPETALRAVTYGDKQIAYPFYFETACLLYNKTYLEDFAKLQLEAEADQAAAEEVQDMIDSGAVDPSGDAEKEDTSAEKQQTEQVAEDTTENAAETISAEAVMQRMEENLPDTIDDILTFADAYDAPEQVEAVFKWDVSDIFYNYFFVGKYVDVGGINGDLADQIHIYNEDAIRCMRIYQSLNQFFSIDTSEISYEGVLQDFLDGKIVYTVATSDALGKIEQAKEDNTFAYEYGVSILPELSDELDSASMSVTQCIAINGYSTQKQEANDFAVYLSQMGSENLYDRTGKLPVFESRTTYQDANKAAFREEYKYSVPVPKMIETSNFWVELEITFAKIWDGDNPNQGLKALSEKIMGQVLGEDYTEEYIDVPEETIEVDEEIIEEET